MSQMKTTGIERRAFNVSEFRTEQGGKLVGHAAVFNELSEDLGWYREKIAPGAFAESIAADDIRALFNHDSNYVLGRNKAKTLALSEDARGLAVEITPPDAQWAKDLVTTITRGDITQMSFGFRVLEEEWAYGQGSETDIRTLKKVQLYDVSPVTFPAYPQTDIAKRSHELWKAKNEAEPSIAVTPNIDRAKIELAGAEGL